MFLVWASCWCWWGNKASLSQRTHFVIWPRSGVPLTCSDFIDRNEHFWHGSYKDNASFLNRGTHARAFSHLSTIFSLTMHMFCQKVKFLKAVKVSERLRRKMAKAKGWGRCFSRVRGIFGEATVPSLWPSTSSWPWWRPVLLSRWYKKTYFVKDIAKSYITIIQTVQSLEGPFEMSYYFDF